MSDRYLIRVNRQVRFGVVPDAPVSLLELLEAAGIETRYHCRTGFCGACRTKLHQGTVHYQQEPLAYVRPGEILPCICRPTSDLDLDH